MGKKLKCGCDYHGCMCNTEVNVPLAAHDEAKVVCSDCADGKHKMAKPKRRSKGAHKCMFVQNSG